MWRTIINIVLGLWLLISAGWLEMAQPAANNNYIIGPCVITCSIISLWPLNRNMIKVNILLAFWLFVSLFLFHLTGLQLLSNVVCGILIVLLSMVKRKTVQRFGGGWKSLFQKQPEHLLEAERISATGDKY